SPIEFEPVDQAASTADFDSILMLEPDGGDATAKYAEPLPAASPSPEPAKAAFEEDEYEPSFEQPRGSRTMFVVAGVAGVILIAAAIGFFALFSGNKAPAAVEAQPVPAVEQPAPEVAQPEPLQVAVENEEADAVAETSAESEASTEAPRATAASARPPARTQDRSAAAAKPAAAKPTPEKKVTVD